MEMYQAQYFLVAYGRQILAFLWQKFTLPYNFGFIKTQLNLTVEKARESAQLL